jgi:hypothetical protein
MKVFFSAQTSARRALAAVMTAAILSASAVCVPTDAVAAPRGKSAIAFRAPARCVPGSLVRVLKRVSARYGPITVNSTWRARGKNRKVGGRGHSMHLACRAVDFRVHGKSRGLTKFLLSQKEVGGYNRYPSGFYHIDNGPRRTW